MKNQNSVEACCVCGKSFKKLTASHLRSHGLSTKEYNILFSNPKSNYAECKFKHKYTGYKCKLQVAPDSNDDHCILHSRNLDKNISQFRNVFNFLLKKYLAENTAMHFEGTIFPEYLDLADFTFNEEIFFNDSRFYGHVNFRYTQFNATAYFRSCYFESVNFRKAEFNAKTSFSGAHFLGRCIFSETKFNPSSDYIRFINVRFLDPSQVIFLENDFSKVLFRDTDLSGINIDNGKWPRFTWRRGKRNYVVDEVYFPEESKFLINNRVINEMNEYQIPSNVIDKLATIKYRIFFTRSEFKKAIRELLSHEEMRLYYSQVYRLTRLAKKNYYNRVRIVYQRLKRNFEDRKSFVEAGDFYYGEMECYRKSNSFRRFFPFNFINLYRLSSGYGQRYLRAGIVLLVLLFFFAILHMVWGLQPTAHNNDYSAIDYDLTDLVKVNCSTAADFYISVIYCTEVLTREEEPDRLFRPITTKGDAINTIFFILIYLQTIFFALALRRYFRR